MNWLPSEDHTPPTVDVLQQAVVLRDAVEAAIVARTEADHARQVAEAAVVEFVVEHLDYVEDYGEASDALDSALVTFACGQLVASDSRG